MSSSDRRVLPPAIFLMGPTTAGKTDLAVALVRQLPCEIISVDSALVYRGMDIGTAKPGRQLLAEAPHRLIDICDPSEIYSAARFRMDALAEMREIVAAGRVPLLVGGTMLYYRALERGLAPLPPADTTVRRRLEAELSRFGLAPLHQRLAELDPVSAKRIHRNDPQRTLRALEVWELTGRPLSHWHTCQRSEKLPYRVVKLVVTLGENRLLRERIAGRFADMLEAGFLDEVRHLLNRDDLTPDLPSMRSVGYRQAIEYLRGVCDYQTFVDRALLATWHLAKRQLTWLRSEQCVCWVDARDREVDAQTLRLASNHIETAGY